MRLHVDVLGEPAPQGPLLVFLHGILGQGGNLRTVARKVLASTGGAAVLVDLRAHGDSQGTQGPDTVEQAARDVLETLAAQGLTATAIVGHSFGGKVALALAQQAPTLEAVVTLDSNPGARPDFSGSEATVGVVAMLKELPGPFARRDDFVAAVVARRLPKGLGQWLAMNLVQGEDGQFRQGLSLPRIDALLASYFHGDLWPVVERGAPRVHLVIGQRSTVYSHGDAVRAQAVATASQGRVTVDVLDTSHWMHVDDLEGTVGVVARRLLRPNTASDG